MQDQSVVHRENSSEKRLLSALLLSGGVFLLELSGGFEFSSSALVADALHVFADIFAIGFSLSAVLISARPPTSTLTYGYHRIEVFASLVNGVSLFLITGLVFYGAYLKIVSPSSIYVPGTILIAAAALAINLVSHSILKGDSKRVARQISPNFNSEDLNLKSASSHIFGDALSSLAVIVGAIAVYFTHDFILDPLVAAFIGLLVLRSAIITTRAGLSIMLESSPVKNMSALELDLEKVKGVSDVHDLHVWRICSHITIATLHACLNDEGKSKRDVTINGLEGKLEHSYGVQHATIQLEEVCCIPKHSHS